MRFRVSCLRYASSIIFVVILYYAIVALNPDGSNPLKDKDIQVEYDAKKNTVTQSYHDGAGFPSDNKTKRHEWPKIKINNYTQPSVGPSNFTMNFNPQTLTHGGVQGKRFITDKAKGWKVWGSFTAPGVYRGCVRLPEKQNGDIRLTSQKTSKTMSIGPCIALCNKKKFTYMGVSKGMKCYCLSIGGNSSLFSYVHNDKCDIPCMGEKKYICGGSHYLSLYRTAVPDKRCSFVQFGKEGSLPLIALASFPRSGNTWTRSLLQRATGIYTGNSEFETEARNKKLINNVFRGGAIDYKLRKTLPVKTHGFSKELISEFPDGAILLIRNPYKAIVAEIFRKEKISTHKQPIKEASKYFNSPKWKVKAHTMMENWRNTATTWIANSPRLLVINYEDMLTNTTQNLKMMLSFLNASVSKERVICAILEEPSSTETGVSLGNFGINPRHYLTFDPFDEQMHQKLDSFIVDVNNTLKDRGLKTLPNYGETTLF